MKRYLFIFVSLFCIIAAYGQEIVFDKELKSFVDIAMSLRQTDSIKKDSSTKAASATLEGKQNWTSFSYSDKSNGECRLVKKNSFRLNPILNRIHGERHGRLGMPPDGFLNDEDSKFDFFLIEKGIKAKGKVRYEFSGRTGSQDFVMVPFNNTSILKVTLTKEKGRLKVSQQKGIDGYFYVHANGKLNPSEKVTLEIENRSNENVSLVIINHNTRK